MESHPWIVESPDTFLTALFAFCVKSVTTCFSPDADKLCVPVGLSVLFALLLLLSCLLVAYQRCKFREENPGESIIVFYCLLGNLCSTVGAILCRQLYIQVLMGAFAVAMDALNCILCCFPVFLCWNSKAERRLRMMKRRRRQHLLAVSVLMVVAGGFLKFRVSHAPPFRPVRERKLLHVRLQVSTWSPFMGNTEILGYILGLLGLVIACTSRFPAFRRACRGYMLTRTHIFSGLLCSLAGALYTTAILLSDTQFGFLMRVMPWLLSSIGCVTLDLLILVTHWCKGGTRQRSRAFFPDTESLLGNSGLPAEDNTAMKRQRKQQIPSSTQTKSRHAQKITEMGHYMDVSIQPARKEEVEIRPLNRMVRMIRVGSFCSTDTSYDSSVVSSDLEWDFEVANALWREPTSKQQERDEFPLKEWPRNPEPSNVSTCPVSELGQKTLSGAEEGGSGANVTKCHSHII